MANIQEAELMLKLYEARREPVMREARNFVNFQFWPASAEEFLKISFAFDKKENAYLRQVLSYWEMVASLYLRGAIADGALFVDWNGEMVWVFAKVKPFLSELREKTSPEFMKRVEAFISEVPEAQQRLALVEQRQAALRSKFTEAAKA